MQVFKRRREIVQDAVLENGLSMLNSLGCSDRPDTRQYIRLSKFLLRTANKLDNVLVDISAENQQQWSSQPVDDLG